MERYHKEELTKIKADHDRLEACLRHFQGDEQSPHTLPKQTQGESHLWRTSFNIANDLSLFHKHRPTGRTIRWHSFVDCIMEIGITLGWKPLKVERYDGTTTFGCLPNTGKPLHQWWRNSMSCLPYVPQGDSIDLVLCTPTYVHRQLWHPCRTIQCAKRHQQVPSHDLNHLG